MKKLDALLVVVMLVVGCSISDTNNNDAPSNGVI